MADGELKGRVAVVTGGNGGIGLGMARGLAAAGAAVVVAGRNAREEPARGRRAAQARAPRRWRIEVDVADEASVEALVRATVERFGRLDILVNNAGINIRKPPQELTARASGARCIDTNLTSAFLASRAAYPVMKKHGRRQDHQHRLDDVHLRRLVRAGLRRLQGRHRAAHQGDGRAPGPRDNIQVNAVLPGWIDTELTTQRPPARSQGLHERVLARTPAARWGVPDDLAGIAVFLASRASDFVTGTAIPVDGGYSIQG